MVKHRISLKTRIKISFLALLIFASIMLGWVFGIHESMHIVACDLSGLNGKFVNYNLGECLGLDTSSSMTFFFVKSAPYLADIPAAIIVWVLSRRLDFVRIIKEGMGGIVKILALNAWNTAIIYDVTINYFSSAAGVTDFSSMAYYDISLLVPSMIIVFISLVFSILFLLNESKNIFLEFQKNRYFHKS